jgi:hypothetical protein
LDAAELEETSVGNHSGHGPTASQLRRNVANAFDASDWPSRPFSVVAIRSTEPSDPEPHANELISGESNAPLDTLRN